MVLFLVVIVTNTHLCAPMSQVLGTISSALEARGLATPDAAVRTIPETIRLSLAAVGEDFTSRMPNIAVTSSVGSATRPLPDTWLAAFTNTASESSSACGEPIATDTSVGVGLDDPIRVLVSGTGMCSDGDENAQQAGSPNLPSGGGSNTTDTNHSSTTVLQYSAGRNPFRPSRDGASTDILQVEVQGGRRPCQERRRQRRRQLGRYDAAEYDTFNISFEIRSRLWGNGSRNEVKSEYMPIPMNDDGSKDTCNASAVQNVSGVRTADDRQMACAWWSKKDGGNGAWRGDGCRLLNVKSSTVCTASSPYVVQTATCNCIFKVKRSDDFEEDLFATTVAIVEHIFSDIERGFLKSLLGENFVPDISAILLCALPLAAYILMVVKQVVCKKRCEHVSSTRFCCRRCRRHRDEARALSRASTTPAASTAPAAPAASVESKAPTVTDDGGVVVDVAPVKHGRIAMVPRASSACVDEADDVEKEEEEEEGETKDRGKQKNGKGAGLRRTLSGRIPSMYSEDHTDVPAVTAATSAIAATGATPATTGELTNSGAPAASGAVVLRTRSSGGRTKMLHRQSKSVNPLLKAVFGFKGVEEGAMSHSFFWWYWMALKRNHDILAPWLAPREPYKTTVHYSTVLFAKFAAIVAATTALFEMHVSFRVPNHPRPPGSL